MSIFDDGGSPFHINDVKTEDSDHDLVVPNVLKAAPAHMRLTHGGDELPVLAASEPVGPPWRPELWQAAGMRRIRRLNLPRPPTRKRVVELGVSNGFGRWMRRRGWAGFTLPLPGVVLVFYWLADARDTPDPFVRVHEFVHVRQDQRLFLFPLRYLLALLTDGGYRTNRFEVEASRIERAARVEGLPDWAKL